MARKYPSADEQALQATLELGEANLAKAEMQLKEAQLTMTGSTGRKQTALKDKGEIEEALLTAARQKADAQAVLSPLQVDESVNIDYNC